VERLREPATIKPAKPSIVAVAQDGGADPGASAALPGRTSQYSPASRSPPSRAAMDPEGAAAAATPGSTGWRA
jgi:hypothetical protein